MASSSLSRASDISSLLSAGSIPLGWWMSQRWPSRFPLLAPSGWQHACLAWPWDSVLDRLAQHCVYNAYVWCTCMCSVHVWQHEWYTWCVCVCVCVWACVCVCVECQLRQFKHKTGFQVVHQNWFL